MPETTGSGCAFLDADRDGWQDLLLIDSRSLEGDAPALALYRNRRDGTFEDVTETAGLANVRGYAMGCAAGDYDNDGWEDLFVTFLGPNRLLRNTGSEGQVAFEEVTAKAGLGRGALGVGRRDLTPRPPSLRGKGESRLLDRRAGSAAPGRVGVEPGTPPSFPGKGVGGLGPGSLRPSDWSSSAAWLDYDNDGRLDLFVGRFVDWSPEKDVYCGPPGGPKRYCPPHAYPAVPNRLYRNLGKGTFRNVSRETGIDRHAGKAWGVATADVNHDGWTDLVVANDTVANFLFINHRGQRFTEEARTAGIAVDESGRAKAGMGIDVADWRNDGQPAVLIGNFANEKLSLFRPEGPGLFLNVADEAGMGHTSLRSLTFGLFFFDYDLDGWQDAFIANGHIDDRIHQFETAITYAQRPLLYRNQAGRVFTEVGEQSGAPFQEAHVLRGCAYADYDRDGDLDIVVVPNNNQPVRLWRNERGGSRNHWVRFRLAGGAPAGAPTAGAPTAGGSRSRSGANRSGIGARVTLRAGGLVQQRWVKSGTSFLSQSELPLTFGLGRADRIDSLEVTWPGGRTDRWQRLSADRAYVVTEGKGTNLLVDTPQPLR